MYKTIESFELEQEMLIFKHSATCPVSATAKAEMDVIAQEKDVFLVVVQDQRELSNEIAEALGIRHESPQFIWVSKGKVACVLNHWHITQSALHSVLD